ncbi:DUF1566 domain-containing protein [Pseudomonas fitomaticsae]|uniref:DUF1566 domain-containing protein n=1 Tax=Pseudomonas fitomaticsae TaxID=2837969 RepID=A0ABY3Q7S2_9PSED|nr:DUF1566 domain-containing protein [Pseudomonas fitomaticsae]UFQ02216.1 DUF1566 domain-containing protein [Pseudomonas fitomaticsae]
MQANQLTTYTRGDLMISSPDESVVLKLASLSISSVPKISESGIPAIGDFWPGEGGVNGGMFPGDGKPYYLIVPTGADAQAELEWGGYREELDGAKSAHDGLTNTADLVETDTGYPAAQFCSSFERDGHKDFYLMSRREASFLEITLGDKDVFSKAWHWTSTQYSANYAFGLDFEDGWINLSGKSLERLVRPVRRRFI